MTEKPNNSVALDDKIHDSLYVGRQDSLYVKSFHVFNISLLFLCSFSDHMRSSVVLSPIASVTDS